MPERTVSPPPAFPVQELRTPNFRDGFYTTLVDRSSAAYQKEWPIKRGTPYAKILGADQRVIDAFSASPLLFLREVRPGNSSASDFGNTSDWVIWIWATDELAENTYNADVDYPGESASVSRYARTSYIRRKDYEANPAVAYGSTLASLLSVAITGAGTGYTQATGTIGNATAEAVCYNGQIIDWIVTVEGSSITSGGSLTITGNGTGATATARIQPATAILTHQEKKELPSDDPRSHDYVKVIRVYEVLPGPVLTGRVMSAEAQGQIATTSEQILAAGAADLTPTYKTLSYADTPLDAVRKRRSIVELDSGTSFPVLTDYDQDPVYQSLITTTFEVVDASLVSAPSITSGVIKRFKHLDKWRSIKIVETYATPASYSEQKFAAFSFPNLLDSFYNDDLCGTIMIARAGFSAMVKIRLDISFGDFEAVEGLTLIPNTFSLGSFKIADVLNDSGTIESSGECTFTASLAASSPSKSTYLAFGSTLQLVSGECVLWKAGIFRKTELYVEML